MNHILIQCHEQAVGQIWQHALDLWPYEDLRWPEISLGIVLGCGSVTPPVPQVPNQQRPPKHRGSVRLLQILISEAAHLIWVLRCERVIREKTHTANEIKGRWLMVINRRLTEDRMIAIKIKRDRFHLQRLENTWEAVLSKDGDLPPQWTHQEEVLVGTRARGT